MMAVLFWRLVWGILSKSFAFDVMTKRSYLQPKRLKPLLRMQSPPSRTSLLVRVGGLCNISHDFNRRHSMGSTLGYLIWLI